MIDRILLAPYYLALEFRHFLYDKGIRKAKKAEVPTVGIGNITVGGTGKTPHTIICDEILGHALHMLDDDSIPISRIAEELHFADQASFCKFFKAQKKKSPMEYRRRNHTDLP